GATQPAGNSAFSLPAEEYYSMPRLFDLDEYEGCLARRGVYCLGSFELSPGGRSSRVYDLMQNGLLPGQIRAIALRPRHPPLDPHTNKYKEQKKEV
ncbi:hypothetical protein MSG28_005474, partial [Choristoneura fumiferana]